MRRDKVLKTHAGVTHSQRDALTLTFGNHTSGGDVFHHWKEIRDKSNQMRTAGVGNRVVLPSLQLGETCLGDFDFKHHLEQMIGKNTAVTKAQPTFSEKQEIKQRDLVGVNHVCVASPPTLTTS